MNKEDISKKINKAMIRKKLIRGTESYKVVAFQQKQQAEETQAEVNSLVEKQHMEGDTVKKNHQ